MRADRAQQQPEREAAEDPRAGIEEEQPADRPSAHVRQLLRVAELVQHPAGERPEDARLDEDREHPAEGDERPERRVHVVDERQADHEDDHSRDRREPGLEQHRRRDESRVGHAGTAGGDDPGGRRPDRARDVLREHREHLRPQRDRIGELDSPLAEDPHPAEHEDEVVRGERGARRARTGRGSRSRGRARRRGPSRAAPRRDCAKKTTSTMSWTAPSSRRCREAQLATS